VFKVNLLFGTWPQNSKLSPADEKVSQQMQAYWVNFAKTGNPNGAGLPVWPKFAVSSQEYLAFTASGAVPKSGMRREFRGVLIQSLKAP
jgi:para-nitrobenzyl esterase